MRCCARSSSRRCTSIPPSPRLCSTAPSTLPMLYPTPALSSGRRDVPATTATSTVSQQDQRLRPPLNAYLVLLVAILLPGFGHVLNGQPRRGLIMQLFMIALGFVTWQLAPPSASFIGKISGG